MRNHPVVSVKHCLSAMALAALAVLAACGGEPAERLVVVAEFKLEENAEHVKKLVSKYDHELVLGKSRNRHTLSAPAPLATELQPGLDRLINHLALDDEELPLEPQFGRPDDRLEYERKQVQDRIKKALLVDLRTRGVEFLSARVVLSERSMNGNQKGPYEHVRAIVLLPNSVAVDTVEAVEADVRECLQRDIKTVSQAPGVRVERVDVQAYLARRATPIAPEVVMEGVPAPTAPLSPPETPPPSPAPAAAAPAMVASEPLPQLPPVGDGIVELAGPATNLPPSCPASPAPTAETAPCAVAADTQRTNTSAVEAGECEHADEPPTEPPATTEAPPAEPSHGAMLILYLVAMASLCGNVAFVLAWWRARRRERERARLARLFAKVA